MTAHELPADAPILVVDDEFLVLWTLQDALEQIGFRSIHVASNVENSIALVTERQFSFAFLDINLGGEKSFPIARALEARGVPFAFVSGYGRAGLESNFAEASVLSKPLMARDLQAVIAVAG